MFSSRFPYKKKKGGGEKKRGGLSMCWKAENNYLYEFVMGKRWRRRGCIRGWWCAQSGFHPAERRVTIAGYYWRQRAPTHVRKRARPGTRCETRANSFFHVRNRESGANVRLWRPPKRMNYTARASLGTGLQPNVSRETL